MGFCCGVDGEHDSGEHDQQSGAGRTLGSLVRVAGTTARYAAAAARLLLRTRQDRERWVGVALRFCKSYIPVIVVVGQNLPIEVTQLAHRAWEILNG